MKNSSICVNSNVIEIADIIKPICKNKEVEVIEKIKENIEYVTSILEHNSRQESIAFNKREILLQVWVLKKIIEEISVDSKLDKRIDLLYENLDKEVFSI